MATPSVIPAKAGIPQFIVEGSGVTPRHSAGNVNTLQAEEKRRVPLRLSRRRIACGYLLLVVLVISGCAVLGRGVGPEAELRRAVLEDESFTVEKVPAEAPAHRAASFRLAAEGYRALRNGQPGKAEDRLEKALSVDPRNPFCYLYLAEIRHRGGDTRQAIILLHQAEVLFQGHPYWLGVAYTQEGRYWETLDSWDKARGAYSEALKHNPWNETAKQKIQ